MNTIFYISVYITIQLILLVLMALAGFYIFIFAFAGLFYRQRKYAKSTQNRRIAVLIPGYKEDEVILEVALDALRQDYPNYLYDVVIIADSFLPETLEKLAELPIKVINVKFEKSTKSKALNKSMELLGDNYDIAVVLDADNLMATDFLLKINAAFEQDFVAIQGHRSAKNLNTSLAVLDAISEEINNHIFRKGHRVLGLSSAIIGSGMAFRYDFFKELMLTVDAVGGFDKEIELKMLKQGHTIEYLDNALVYDEKVQKAEVFSNQRKRWLSAQLHYFRQDFMTSVLHLVSRGNIDYFDKAIQFIQPPRILLLGTMILFTGFFMLLNMWMQLDSMLNAWWISASIMVFLAFAFSVPKKFYNKTTFVAMAGLPAGMLLMFKTLLHLKGANKKFIHTKHSASKSVIINKKPI